MRRSQSEIQAKPEPEKDTYDVLQSFWHDGRLIDQEDAHVKKDGVVLTEGRARFYVLNGTLKLRSSAKTAKTTKTKAD